MRKESHFICLHTSLKLGSGQENELLLMSVLDCLFNAVTQILRKNVDKKALFDNLEVAVILVEE